MAQLEITVKQDFLGALRKGIFNFPRHVCTAVCSSTHPPLSYSPSFRSFTLCVELASLFPFLCGFIVLFLVPRRSQVGYLKPVVEKALTTVCSCWQFILASRYIKVLKGFIKTPKHLLWALVSYLVLKNISFSHQGQWDFIQLIKYIVGNQRVNSCQANHQPENDFFPLHNIILEVDTSYEKRKTSLKQGVFKTCKEWLKVSRLHLDGTDSWTTVSSGASRCWSSQLQALSKYTACLNKQQITSYCIISVTVLAARS